MDISQAAPTQPQISIIVEHSCEVCGAIFSTSKLLRKHVKDLDHRKWKQDLAARQISS